MFTTRIEQIYHDVIKAMPAADQLQLIALISQRLREHVFEQRKTKPRSLLELEGLGAEIWHGVDAQGYVDVLRD